MEAGVLDASQLQGALAEQKKWGGRLGRTLVEMGFVDEDSMVRALSRQLKLPVVDLDTLRLPPTVTQILTVGVCERYGVFPLGVDLKQKQVQLATSDPTNVAALNELTFKTGYKVQTAVATGSSIDRAIRRMYYGEQTQASKTATPQRFGVQEPTFGEDEISGVKQRPVPPVATVPPAPPPVRAADPMAEIEAAAREAEIARLKDRVAALEKQTTGQVRALRALVELLVESGLIARDEYLQKAQQGQAAVGQAGFPPK
ncbi:MAG: general secretion pathway protein GspE [Myxococcaceae bacterium]|nr:general secretion pathway protein GspE [Myxococcaceae bacterium]